MYVELRWELDEKSAESRAKTAGKIRGKSKVELDKKNGAFPASLGPSKKASSENSPSFRLLLRVTRPENPLHPRFAIRAFPFD